MIPLLIVDDDPHFLDVAKICLEKTGDFTADTAESAREALEMMEPGTYDAIVSDYEMPKINGIEFLKTVRGGGSTIPFILFTGKGREEVVIEALNEGADFYLQKGGRPEAQFAELSHKIRQAVSYHQAKDLYQTVFENTGTAMMILEDDTTISYANAEIERLTGYSKKEIEGRVKWTELLLEDDVGKMMEYHRLRRIEPDAAPKTYEIHFINKQGEIRDASLVATMMPGTEKSIISLIDITDRKQVEEAVQRSENLYRTLFESTSAPTLILAEDTTILWANSAVEEFSGFTKDEVQRKKTLIGFVVEEDLERMREYLQLLKSDPGTTPENYEFRFIDRAGDLHNIYLTAAIIPETKLSVASMMDITDLKSAERALENTNTKLQLLSSITRHDILNQVNVLESYILLLGGLLPDDPEMQNYFDKITEMTAGIESQITFTRDYEHLGMDPSRWQGVDGAVERAAAGCANLTSVNVSIDTSGVEIFADPMLEKVFINICDNAVRHGGHVTEISVTCREEEGADAIITLEDDGVGIPVDRKEEIFGRGFGRNTGYGLFLVKEVLDITGMSIRETGEEGKGARFEITVPPGVWRRG